MTKPLLDYRILGTAAFQRDIVEIVYKRRSTESIRMVLIVRIISAIKKSPCFCPSFSLISCGMTMSTSVISGFWWRLPSGSKSGYSLQGVVLYARSTDLRRRRNACMQVFVAKHSSRYAVYFNPTSMHAYPYHEEFSASTHVTSTLRSSPSTSTVTSICTARRYTILCIAALRLIILYTGVAESIAYTHMQYLCIQVHHSNAFEPSLPSCAWHNTHGSGFILCIYL